MRAGGRSENSDRAFHNERVPQIHSWKGRRLVPEIVTPRVTVFVPLSLPVCPRAAAGRHAVRTVREALTPRSKEKATEKARSPRIKRARQMLN